LACLATLAWLGACSSDNNIDAGTTPTIDGGTTGGDGGGGTTFTAQMTPAKETPPCAGAGASAMGTATAVLSSDEKTLTVTFTYSGLSGAATLAHVHYGSTTVSGPNVLNFTTYASGTSKAFTSTDYSPSGGAPPDFAGFVTALKGGMAYVNVHTSACPNGEIRGQLGP
jgi:hypothetical protein